MPRFKASKPEIPTNSEESEFDPESLGGYSLSRVKLLDDGTVVIDDSDDSDGSEVVDTSDDFDDLPDYKS